VCRSLAPVLPGTRGLSPFPTNRRLSPFPSKSSFPAQALEKVLLTRSSGSPALADLPRFSSLPLLRKMVPPLKMAPDLPPPRRNPLVAFSSRKERLPLEIRLQDPPRRRASFFLPSAAAFLSGEGSLFPCDCGRLRHVWVPAF